MMAPATGQYYGASDYTPFPPQLPPQFGFAQPYSPLQQQQNQHQFISPQQHSVQPHINPRFAANFGLNLDMMQQPPGQQYLAYGQYETPTTPVYEGGWDEQWNQGYSSCSSGEHPHVKQEHGHNGSGT
jgi:H/ACA ribonucleoprotein complex non-core subunit NAF1